MLGVNKPDFKNPNREPVITVMGLASMDDGEFGKGFRRAAQVGLRQQVAI